MSVRSEITQYGFNYGAAEITRVHHNDKKGYVILHLKTRKKELQIYVTKTGKVRIFDYLNSKEIIL